LVSFRFLMKLSSFEKVVDLFSMTLFGFKYVSHELISFLKGFNVFQMNLLGL